MFVTSGNKLFLFILQTLNLLWQKILVYDHHVELTLYVIMALVHAFPDIMATRPLNVDQSARPTMTVKNN